jgi:hypothetical protein
MILLFNVFVTDGSSTRGQWESLGVSYDRGNLSKSNKLDILKYSLASYAVAYPWKRAIINVELDNGYNSEENQIELRNFIHNEFKDIDLVFSNKRNLSQYDWANTYNLLNDDVIFYQCNHDHIFIDSSNEYLIELVKLKDIYKENLTITTSHFPEIIRTSKPGYIDHNESISSNPNLTYELKDNHIYYEGKVLDSLIIITKEIYHNWFLEGDWSSIQVPKDLFSSGKIELTRTEGTGIIGIGGIKDILGSPFIKQKIVTPYKELFRHFDGYWHQKISNNQCPAIDIPNGFFEYDIKIRYGYDDYKEGWVNINPKSEFYYAYDKKGVDYKCLLEDIPLVWKNRISTIDSNPDIDKEEMIQYYLKSILEMIYTHPKYDQYLEDELKNSILVKYLENHPEYRI